MIKVGVRELKSRLSYYLQLMQTGETIAVKVRNQVVGFLSHLQPSFERKTKRLRGRDLKKRIEQWKKDGILLSGGLCKLTSFEPVKLKGNLTSTDLIRQMRNEDL